MDDMIWQWDGYCIRKRSRAAVEKDIADDHARGMKRRRYAFDSELAAVEAGFEHYRLERDAADRAAFAAQKIVRKWFLRRKKLKEAELKSGEIREAE